MPKLKTNRGAAKRLRVTKKGKFKFSRSGRRHLLECKSANRGRSLRRPEVIGKADERRMRQLLPYG